MRRTAIVLCWLLLAVVALGVGARWVDLSVLQVPLIQSVFPVFGVMSTLLLLAGLIIRAWRYAAVAALIAVAPVALAVGSLRSQTVPAAVGDETIMFANLQVGQADPAAVLRLVHEHHVATLVLAEVTPQSLAALDAAGLAAALPHRAGRAAAPYAGTIVSSVHSLTLRSLTEEPSRFYQPVVTVHAAHDYLLHAVHTYAPVGRNTVLWRDDLHRLVRWRATAPQDQPIVMAGDFNASRAMPGFRQIADGMTDTIGATGAGWVRTWPHGQRIPPFIQLDHILARIPGRDSTVVAAGVVEVPDTDHYAVWATLSVTPATISP